MSASPSCRRALIAAHGARVHRRPHAEGAGVPRPPRVQRVARGGLLAAGGLGAGGLDVAAGAPLGPTLPAAMPLSTAAEIVDIDKRLMALKGVLRSVAASPLA